MGQGKSWPQLRRLRCGNEGGRIVCVKEFWCLILKGVLGWGLGLVVWDRLCFF